MCLEMPPLMQWEGIEPPALCWLDDEWFNPRTKEIFIATECGWKKKRCKVEKVRDYGDKTKVFGVHISRYDKAS